jgi:hypothetical protein
LLIQFSFVILYGIVLFKIHKHLSKKDDESGENLYEIYNYDYSGMVGGMMIVGALIFIIAVLYYGFSIPNIINGYFNPEYWALNEILNTFL